MSAVCLIPARGGSKRFPRKNIAELNGKPLIAYVIEAALRSNCFEEVIVSTEDAEIKEVAEKFGATIHPRSSLLASDEATVIQVCFDVIKWLKTRGSNPDVLGVILPTAVLIESNDLREGLYLLDEQKAHFVMAVTTYLETPFMALHEKEGFLQPYFDKDFLEKKNQDLPKVCVDSGSFYFAKVEPLMKEKTFYGERLSGYFIPRDRSIDIDEPAHLRIAQALMQVHRQEKV